MSRSRTVSGWIACPVREPDRIEYLRDRLYGYLGAPEPYRRAETPHVSLFGVRLPRDRAREFERALCEFGDAVGPWRGETDGYHFHPSRKNPMVVALALPFPLAAVGSPIADLLRRHGGRISRDPVPPHVTLFKGGSRGEELQWARVSETTRGKLGVLADPDPDSDPDDDVGLDTDVPTELVAPAVGVTIDPPEITWDGSIPEGEPRD